MKIIPDSEPSTSHNPLEEELEQFRKEWIKEVNLKKKSHQNELLININKEKILSEKKVNQEEKLEKKIKEDSLEIPEKLPTNWKDLTCLERQSMGLEFYKRAVAQEKSGKLGDALNNYRQAFKVDPEVELNYKEYYYNLSKNELEKVDKTFLPPFSGIIDDFELNNNIFLGSEYKNSTKMDSILKEKKEIDWEKMDPMYELIENFKQFSINNNNNNNNNNNLLNEEDEKKFRPIIFKKANEKIKHSLNDLPEHIIIKILSIAMLNDIQSIGSFSLTCIKGLFLSRDKYLWSNYGNILYNKNSILYKSFQKNHPNIKLIDYIDYHFEGKWRFFLIEYPRIRFDGIYISTCYYIRQGIAENSFHRPIHLVTYYRYLRFYPDGTCIKRLTTDEPINVVYNMDINKNVFKDIFIGNYYLTKDHTIEIDLKGEHRKLMKFYLSLELKSTNRGKHNKLNWIEYSSIFNEGEKTIYSLKQNKPFYFSRVRSYTLDWNKLVYG